MLIGAEAPLLQLRKFLLPQTRDRRLPVNLGQLRIGQQLAALGQIGIDTLAPVGFFAIQSVSARIRTLKLGSDDAKSSTTPASVTGLAQATGVGGYLYVDVVDPHAILQRGHMPWKADHVLYPTPRVLLGMADPLIWERVSCGYLPDGVHYHGLWRRK